MWGWSSGKRPARYLCPCASLDGETTPNRQKSSLESLLATSGAGDFDGEEFGNGHCALFMVGNKPDAMYLAVESALRQAGFLRLGRIGFRLPSSAQPYKTIDL